MYVATVLEQPLALEPVTRDDFVREPADPSSDHHPDETVTVFVAGEPSAVDTRHR